MATFPKRTIYHSTLRQAGPLVIALVSEVRDSKYAGKPPYVHFRVQGDDTEYQYQVENEAIADQLRSLPRNQWLEVSAEGTKDTALLHVAYDRHGSGPAPSSAPRGNGNGRAASAPHGDGDETLARVLWRCLEVSATLCQQFEAKYQRPMTENERTIAVHLAIEVHKGNRMPLSKPVAAPRPAAPPPPPPPPPDDDYAGVPTGSGDGYPDDIPF